MFNGYRFFSFIIREKFWRWMVVMAVLYYSIHKVPGVVKFIEEKKAEWWLPGAEERREWRIILEQVQSFSLGR